MGTRVNASIIVPVVVYNYIKCKLFHTHNFSTLSNAQRGFRVGCCLGSIL
jgi:hypothetical protein